MTPEEREAQAAKNRADFPEAWKFLAELRKHDPDAKLLYANENGKTIGKEFK